MNEPPFELAAAHRWFGVEWNNEAWDALEKPSLTESEQLQAIHLAHASCCHWQRTGTPVNHVRALCLVANVEAAYGAPAAAMRFGDACAELAAGVDGLADWDLAFIADARARACAAAWRVSHDAAPEAGELLEQARVLRDEARRQGDMIADPEDKKFFEGWFAAGSWHGLDG